MSRSFLSEAGGALTFFASVFCVKTKNEVGFGRSAKLKKCLGQNCFQTLLHLGNSFLFQELLWQLPLLFHLPCNKI
jgi:hypothetical protein